jgi:hypothetical protein
MGTTSTPRTHNRNNSSLARTSAPAKNTAMPNPKPRLLLESEAVAHTGGEARFRELCDGWGLKPHRKTKGVTFYSIEDLKDALQKRNKPHES